MGACRNHDGATALGIFLTKGEFPWSIFSKSNRMIKMIHIICRTLRLPFQKICDEINKKQNQRLMMAYVLNLKPVTNKKVDNGVCKV